MANIGVWPEYLVYYPKAWKSVRTPNGQRDIVRQISMAIAGIATIGPAKGVLWRGQGSCNWALTSKLGRTSSPGRSQAARWRRHEVDMIRTARLVGADDAYRMTDGEILARLRHHGAATRLIDCTQDPMVALWFAVSRDDFPETDLHDGLVLAIDRGDLEAIEEPWNCTYEDLLKPLRTGGRFARTLAVPPIDPRIGAQRGVFVLAPLPEIGSYSELPIAVTRTWKAHSTERLEKLCGRASLAHAVGRLTVLFPTVMAVAVPKEIKPMLREVLDRNYGLNRRTIYPDYPGLGALFASGHV